MNETKLNEKTPFLEALEENLAKELSQLNESVHCLDDKLSLIISDVPTPENDRVEKVKEPQNYSDRMMIKLYDLRMLNARLSALLNKFDQVI